MSTMSLPDLCLDGNLESAIYSVRRGALEMGEDANKASEHDYILKLLRSHPELGVDLKEKEKNEKEEKSEEEKRKREEKEKAEEEYLERKHSQALRETEERMMRMMDDCTKAVEDAKKECKDIVDAFKKSFEEKEKKEKAEHAAKLAALELTIQQMVENQKKADKKREEECLENAKNIKILMEDAEKEKEKKAREDEKEKEKKGWRFKFMEFSETDVLIAPLIVPVCGVF